MVAELIGRAQLWSNALAECQQSLELAQRLTNAASAAPVVAEQENFEQFYSATTGRSYDPRVAYACDREVFVNFQPILPMPSECHLAAYHLRRIAVIYLAQIYSSGNPAVGIVAKNKGDAGNELRSRLELLAFPDATARAAFGDTIKSVLRLRDKQIGHADGECFDVRHQSNAVVSTLEPVPYEICLELLRVLPPLNAALMELISVLSDEKSRTHDSGVSRSGVKSQNSSQDLTPQGFQSSTPDPAPP